MLRFRWSFFESNELANFFIKGFFSWSHIVFIKGHTTTMLSFFSFSLMI